METVCVVWCSSGVYFSYVITLFNKGVAMPKHSDLPKPMRRTANTFRFWARLVNMTSNCLSHNSNCRPSCEATASHICLNAWRVSVATMLLPVTLPAVKPTWTREALFTRKWPLVAHAQRHINTKHGGNGCTSCGVEVIICRICAYEETDRCERYL